MRGATPAHWISFAWLDVVRCADGRFRVIEGQVRMAAGMAYPVAARDALRDAAPDGVDEPRTVILSEGRSAAGWWEHERLAHELRAPVVTLAGAAGGHQPRGARAWLDGREQRQGRRRKRHLGPSTNHGVASYQAYMHPHWPRYMAVLVAALVFPALALAQSQAPNASFSFSPESPRVGDEVTLTSSSCDPGSRLSRQAWDLDGDGAYDDAEGPVAAIRFSGSGAHTVGLQVTDRDDLADVERRTIMVDTQYALPRPDSARLLSPFPVVTLGGRLTPDGARIRRLSVRAPVCARVVVRCRGANCPAKAFSAFVGRRALRIRRFELRLRAGAVLTIAVSKGARIGKLTTFRIRTGRAPLRRDRCLRPGEQEGSRCPRD